MLDVVEDKDLCAGLMDDSFAVLFNSEYENDRQFYSTKIGKHIELKRIFISKYKLREYTCNDIYKTLLSPLERHIHSTIQRCAMLIILSVVLSCVNMRECLILQVLRLFRYTCTFCCVRELVIFAAKHRKRYVLNYVTEKVLKIESLDTDRLLERLAKLDKRILGVETPKNEIKAKILEPYTILEAKLKSHSELLQPYCSKLLVKIILNIFTSPKVQTSEIEVMALIVFSFSILISLALFIYYMVEIIIKSQTDPLYLFRRAYSNTFKCQSLNDDLPHVKKQKIQKSRDLLAKYLYEKPVAIASIGRIISFALCCAIPFLLHFAYRSMFKNEVFYVYNVEIKTNTLCYALGAVLYSIKVLSFQHKMKGRKIHLYRWCILMNRKDILLYRKSKSYLKKLIGEFYVYRAKIVAMEIISPFIIPYQLCKLAWRLEKEKTIVKY